MRSIKTRACEPQVRRRSIKKVLGETDFRDIKIETVIPLFTGMFCALFLSAFIAVQSGVYKVLQIDNSIFERHEEEDVSFLLTETEDTQDPVLEYYRNTEYRAWVVEFFAGICSSYEIAMAVLDNCDKFDVSPALAFALSWEESKFNPRAINRYNRDGSIDRGLFQLNNKSFPNLDIIVFFDIQSNAHYGIGHLRYCLDIGGSEVSALAMYNAGTGRVRTTGAPEVTLNYISRVLGNRGKIETRFHSRLIKEEESRMAQKEENTAPPYFNRTLMTASPL